MDTLAALLANALMRFEPVDLTATPQLTAELSQAFLTWEGSDLVAAVRQRLEAETEGQATISYAPLPTFTTHVRGPGAYLLLTRQRRFILTPTIQPIQFDS